MKEQLIELSKEKGFKSIAFSRMNIFTIVDIFYYLWLCELKKWLIEEYNIKVDATSSSKNMKGEWVDWHCSVNGRCIIDHRDGLDAYELALAKALFEALKLIKI